MNGQVDPAILAANCTTTVEGLTATFNALYEEPFVNGTLEGELPQRFFPDPSEQVFETYG